MAELNFDAEQVAPKEPFTPIPPGQYQAMILESEMKGTRKPGGQYLNLAFVITEGEYTSRRLWTRLNLINANPKAVEIAQRELSTICRACGRMQVADSTELHEIPILITVRIDSGDQNNPPSNEIRDYAPLESAPAAPAAPVSPQRQTSPAPQRPAASTAPARQAPAMAGAGGNQPPWKRK